MTMATTDASRVDILLATFNGARFIEEQIESLFRQTYRNWRVLARDDGSVDGTIEILRRYAERHPDQFVLITDNDGNLGYIGNFARLMEQSTATHVALCDQDDVWLPHKLATTIEKMESLERAHGPRTPLLVFTDLKVVDEKLGPVCRSLWEFGDLDPAVCGHFNMMLLQNVVTGCTIVMNRPLVGLCLPIPGPALAHDWWIALVASAFGQSCYLSDQTVLYRQHGENQIGASALRGGSISAAPLRFIRTFRRDFHRKLGQVAAFAEKFGTGLSPDQDAIVGDLLAIPQSHVPKRLHYLLRRKFLRRHSKFGKNSVALLAYAVFTTGHGTDRHRARANWRRVAQHRPASKN